MNCKWIYVFILFLRIGDTADDEWVGIANHKTWEFLDTFDCGFNFVDRIIGGLNAAPKQFPWITRLGYSTREEKELDWMCGGALLSDRHVITAAHCVVSSIEAKLVKIRMGEYDIRTNPDCQFNKCAPPVQDRGIKTIISHPNFNKPAFHNDIAIIVLDEPVEMNDYVIPICLPREEQLRQYLELGEKLIVAGWGKMNMTTDERAKILQYVTVPVLKLEMCNTFGKRFTLAESEICAGAQEHKDACGGDSGGPLMKVFDTQDGPKSFLVGVVSFGPTICGIRKPGVYTSIKFFLGWILDNLI
nr:melanization protease 1-like [Danaus plexippus plexippus]